MNISEEAYRPDPGGALVLRSSPFNNFMFILGAGAVLAGSLFFGARVIRGFSPMVILLLSIPIGITSLLVIALFAAAVHSFRASLRPSNWSVQIGAQSLVLNLRDYRNATPGQPVPTLSIPIQEITGAHQVTEKWMRQKSKGRASTTVQRKYVDLAVGENDTSQLAALLTDERLRNSRKKGKEKGSSSFRFHRQHVLVLEPGVVRLVANKKLVSALKQLVTFGEPRMVDLDQELAGEPSLLRARALDLRGERIQATAMLANAEGFSLSEAKKLLDQKLDPANA